MLALRKVQKDRIFQLKTHRPGTIQPSLTKAEFEQVANVFADPHFHTPFEASLILSLWEIAGWQDVTRLYLQYLKKQLPTTERLQQLEEMACFVRASLESEATMLKKLIDLGTLSAVLKNVTETLAEDGWPDGFRFEKLSSCARLPNRGLHIFQVAQAQELRIFLQVNSTANFELVSFMDEYLPPLEGSSVRRTLFRHLHRPNQTANRFLETIQLEAPLFCPESPHCRKPDDNFKHFTFWSFFSPINPVGNSALRMMVPRQWGALMKFQTRLAQIERHLLWVEEAKGRSQAELSRSHPQVEIESKIAEKAIREGWGLAGSH